MLQAVRLLLVLLYHVSLSNVGMNSVIDVITFTDTSVSHMCVYTEYTNIYEKGAGNPGRKNGPIFRHWKSGESYFAPDVGKKSLEKCTFLGNNPSSPNC